MNRLQAIRKYNLARDYAGDGIDWRTETYSADTVKDGIRTAIHLKADELLLSENVLKFFLIIQKWDLNKTDKNGFPKPIFNRVYEIQDD